VEHDITLHPTAVVKTLDRDLVQMARAMAEMTSVCPFDDHYEFSIASGLHDLETVIGSSRTAGDMLAVLLLARQLGAERVVIALEPVAQALAP
jgi:hypothetical protein